MPSSESPLPSSASRTRAESPVSSGPTVRLEAFHIDALLGRKEVIETQCSGWEADYCVADIEAADLVSLRFDPAPEVSREPDTSGRQASAEAYYQNCSASLDQSLPLRLGLCCCRWQPSEAIWELRSHELALFPGDLLEMSKELKASRFRIAGKVREASSSTEPAKTQAEAELGPPGRWSEQLASCVKWVVNTLCAVQVPIVLHNGLPDLLHLCDKFGERVPDGNLALGKMLCKHFPAIFDTGLLVQDRFQTPAEQGKLLSLEEMNAKLMGAPRIVGIKMKEFGMYTHRASSHRNKHIFGRGKGAAARDAMCIAEAFLAEMGHRVSESSMQSKSDLNKQASVSENRENVEESPLKPSKKRLAEELPGSPTRKIPKCDAVEGATDASPQKTSRNLEASTPRASEKPASTEEPTSPCKVQRQKDQSPTTAATATQNGNLLPSLLNSHASCRRFHNRVAAERAPCLHLRQSPLRLPGKAAIDLHSLLRELGAKEDSQGRPVVTKAMTKQLRRVLGEMKHQSEVTS